MKMDQIAQEKKLGEINLVELRYVSWDEISANEFLNWVARNSSSRMSQLMLFGVPCNINFDQGVLRKIAT